MWYACVLCLHMVYNKVHNYINFNEKDEKYLLLQYSSSNHVVADT